MHNVNQGDYMGNDGQRPQTFVEKVLDLLEEHFPWLGSGQDEPISGADAVDEIADLYQSLLRERNKDRGNGGASEVVIGNHQFKRTTNGSPQLVSEGPMRNVTMIRKEPGLVSIPVEKAVYCENCRTVSSSRGKRCGLCGSERIVELASLFTNPWDPGPTSAAALAA
jgi:hypothetical protein